MFIINIDDRISWEEYLYHSLFKLNKKLLVIILIYYVIIILKI